MATATAEKKETKSKKEKAEGKVQPSPFKLEKSEWPMYLLKVAIIVLYFLSFKLVWNFISTPIVITAIGLLSKISWKKVVPTAILTTAIVYVVFIMWLNVYIPF